MENLFHGLMTVCVCLCVCVGRESLYAMLWKKLIPTWCSLSRKIWSKRYCIASKL